MHLFTLVVVLATSIHTAAYPLPSASSPNTPHWNSHNSLRTVEQSIPSHGIINYREGDLQRNVKRGFLDKLKELGNTVEDEVKEEYERVKEKIDKVYLPH